jgi:hypothetical protein
MNRREVRQTNQIKSEAQRNHIAMKTWTALLTALIGLFLFTPTQSARADHGYSSRTSTCGSCGGAVYYTKVFAGYDCHGCPVYRWVRQEHYCQHESRGCDHEPRYNYRSPGCNSGYSGRSSYYYNSRPNCGTSWGRPSYGFSLQFGR